MAEFKLSDKVNPNRVFLLQTSELEKRLDPFYYIPELKELEEKVREKDVEPLRHFVKNVSSGATPKTAEKEKYYSDKENGIPFLRVQNLSPTGILDYEDCKYINNETHEGYLKRSQVKGGDLLVKITGVGRMAVASVAPDGFVGNTNQHMVVIKTGSKEVSTILASYLNSDIGEKLASRRATGGTRPALDYPALLSIPILYDERILTITKKAVEEKNEKQNKAKELLASIDKYLLNQLGINLPKKDNSLEKRIFTTSLNQISGRRFDPFYNDIFYLEIEKEINNCVFPYEYLKDLCFAVSGVVYSGKDQRSSGKKIIRANNITLATNELNYNDIRYIREDIDLLDSLLLKKKDILMSSASGSKEHVGKVAYIEEDLDYYFGGFMNVLRKKQDNYNQKYLFEFLQSSIFRAYLYKNLGGTNINNLGFNMISHLKIPIPPKEKQTEIANHIADLRNQEKQLELDTDQIMIEAKMKVENIILG
jgi:restriction endonuclease S subunit